MASLVRVEKNQKGFEIIAFIQEPFSDMYERLTHAAIFQNKEKADAVRQKIVHALNDNYGNLNALDLTHWLWTPSKATPFGSLQNNPTAQRYTV